VTSFQDPKIKKLKTRKQEEEKEKKGGGEGVILH
jgi:hypothetical protein